MASICKSQRIEFNEICRLFCKLGSNSSRELEPADISTPGSGLWVPAIPFIVGAINGHRRNSIVPVLRTIVRTGHIVQIAHIMPNPAVDAPEIIVTKNSYLGSVEEPDRRDLIVESWRHRPPVLAKLQAKIVAPEVRVLIKASPGLRWSRVSPLRMWLWILSLSLSRILCQCR